MKKIIIAGIMLMLAVMSCTKDKSASAAGNGDIKDPHVVAVVAGEKILDSDVEAVLSQLPEQARARYASPEGKKEFVSSLAEIKVMAMAAKKKGLDKDPEMKRKIEFLGDQVLARSLAESTVGQIKVSDEEITKFYNDNKDKFSVEYRIKLRHILVDGEAEAKAILADLKKGGDFSKLAQEKSKCPSSQKGGDLGWVTKGMMVPEFEKAAFGLKKGQMSDVVKTNFGYHIIINDDEEAAKQRELPEVKDMIVKQIQGEKGEEAVGKLIEQVKKDYPVTFNDAYFTKGREDAATPPAKP